MSKLLVVDDETDVGDSVHDLLRREFTVLRARSAEEGLKLMRDNEIHIIMTDQRMPKVSGVELLKSIRTDDRNLRSVSPRSTLLLARACQARAMFSGRGFVSVEDVKALAPDRVLLMPEGTLDYFDEAMLEYVALA